MIYKCSYCDYQSPYKGNLKTHVKNKHENKFLLLLIIIIQNNLYESILIKYLRQQIFQHLEGALQL